MNLLVISSVYPNSKDPNYGIFVRNRVVALNKYAKIKVIAPVPWFPFLALIRIFKGENFRPIPLRQETRDGIEISYPRAFSIPLFFKSLDGLFFFFAIFFEIARLKKNFKPEIIQAHFVYPVGVGAFFASRLLKIPLFLSVRGIIRNYPIYSLLIKWQIKLLLKRAERIICISQGLKQLVLKIGIPAEKISVIPNGVDLQRFHIKERGESRKKLSLPPEKKIILSVGSLSKRKGFNFLINAVSLMAYKEISLYIIGGHHSGIPYMLKKLGRLIRRKKLEDKIFLIGKVPNEKLCDWYNGADVFCLLSSAEGCPNVILESLACGLPVVGNNIPGIAELVSSEDAGIIVDARDIKNVAEGLRKALGKTWDRQLIRKRVENRSWDNAAQREYEEIVKYLRGEKDLKR